MGCNSSKENKFVIIHRNMTRISREDRRRPSMRAIASLSEFRTACRDGCKEAQAKGGEYTSHLVVLHIYYYQCKSLILLPLIAFPSLFQTPGSHRRSVSFMERLVAKDIITTKLNKTEINVLVNVFRSSMNENNLLTMEEFRGVYIIENDALAQATFDMFDTNKSGDIDIHEFINGYSRWKECLTNTGDRQLLAFSMFDVNETGSLTRETFKEMLKATMDVSQFDLPFISSVATRELAEAFFKACGEAGPYSPEIVVDYRKILHILRNASWSKTMLNFTADDIEKLFFAESGKEEVNFDMNISELISLLICVQANKLLPEIDNLLNL